MILCLYHYHAQGTIRFFFIVQNRKFIHVCSLSWIRNCASFQIDCGRLFMNVHAQVQSKHDKGIYHHHHHHHKIKPRNPKYLSLCVSRNVQPINRCVIITLIYLVNLHGILLGWIRARFCVWSNARLFDASFVHQT